MMSRLSKSYFNSSATLFASRWTGGTPVPTFPRLFGVAGVGEGGAVFFEQAVGGVELRVARALADDAAELLDLVVG